MLRRIFFALSALLVVALVVLAWYVSSKGFTRKWRTYIVGEFRKAGVEVHIRRLTLDPFRGLVAREVSVLDVRDRKRVLAWIDEVLLGVNYASALRGETFLDSADLREANLWLPLKATDPDGPKVTISRLNARFFLPPQQIYLARAQAEIQGIQLFASGRLINPQAYHPSHSETSPVADVAAEIMEELGKLKYGGAPPVLTCEFSGDVAHPEQIQVDLRLHARAVRRKGYELSTVDLLASYRKGMLEIQQLNAADARGELQAAGTYDWSTREVRAHARCGLHLQEMDRAFHWFPHLGDWVLTEAPTVELQVKGRAGPEATLRVTGHAELPRSAYRQLAFKRLSTDFSWEPDSWSLRGLHLVYAEGELSGDVTSQPGQFRARLTSSLNPRAIAHLLPAASAEWLSRFDFPVAPTLSLEVQGTAPALAACTAQGHLDYSQVLYQGAVAMPAHSELRYQDGLLTVAPFVLEQSGLAAPAQLVFDFTRHEVRQEASSLPHPTPADGAPTTE